MKAFHKALPVLTVPLAARARPGMPDPANAPAVVAAIEAAVAAVVVAARPQPSSPTRSPSTWWRAADFPYPGHTEFLGALARAPFPRPQRSRPS